MSSRRAMLALAVGACGLSTSAQALSIVFNDTTPGGMAAPELAAFNAAAALWQGLLADPVTVYVDIGFRDDGANGILGSAGSNYAVKTYADVRSALFADRSSAIDDLATAHLQAGPLLTFQATNLDGSTRLDSDSNPCPASGPSVACRNNNGVLALTTANARALGFAGNPGASNPDAVISFNGFYAGAFDFTRSDGINANQSDFVSVAAHEIGHALGFVSGVDDVDYCMQSSNPCGFDNKFGLEKFAVYAPLDLFRYSAPGTMNVQVGGSPYFSVDGGVTAIESFSTGRIFGDGHQASHFINGPQNLMNPVAFAGLAINPTAADLAAMDAVGWDVIAVPEPATYALLLAGLGVVGAAARRRGG